MNIFLFGNPDLSIDNTPLALKPGLEKRFPDIRFIALDPHEVDEPPENPWALIDTVAGLDRVRLLAIEDIARPEARLTAHDFDLATTLLFFRKLDSDFRAHIIGIPMGVSAPDVLEDVSIAIRDLS